MTETLKEIGIFIVIAQAVLYFVPGEHYTKYVKVIVGIIMIAKLSQPILNLAFSGDWEEILEQSLEFAGQAEYGADSLTAEDTAANSENAIYQGIEEELIRRLRENPAEGYQVQTVRLETDETGTAQKLSITVAAWESADGNGLVKIEKITVGEEEGKETEEEDGEREKLEEYYGSLLSVSPEQIRVSIK